MSVPLLCDDGTEHEWPTSTPPSELMDLRELRGEMTMHLIVYGDFNCPYSCLASARADVLLERGLADVEWRAVEHDRDIPEPSEPVQGALTAMLDREVAEVRSLLRPGESFPIKRPPVHPNTRRAIAAFAASPSDDDHDTRRKLFAALWQAGRDLGDPAVVHEITGPDSMVSLPLVAAWRDAWLDCERVVVPMLVLPDGYVSRGLGVLARLADLAAAGPRRELRWPAELAT
jgi:2-hydroxychromene-2-carboxylate isomerase